MVAKTIVLGIIVVVGFFIIRDYYLRKKHLPVEKKNKYGIIFEVISCLFEALLEGLF